MKKLANVLFGGVQIGKVERGTVALSAVDGRTVVRRKNGDYVTYDLEQDVIVNASDAVVDLADFFYQIPVTADQVKRGDLIKNGINYYIVKEVKDGSIKGMNLNTGSGSELCKEVNLFGAKYFAKIVNVMADGFGQAGTDATNGFNPLLLMAMKDDSDTSIKDIMMLQAMSGQAGTDFAKNPMALMALLGDDSDVDPLALMMLTQGQDGTNPMSNPLLLTSLLKDDKGDSKDLIKMMALTGGLGGQAGAINPMTMLALLK